MKNKIKALLLLVIVGVCALVLMNNTTNTEALSDYIDEDGNVHAGWSMVGSSMDQKTWYFDDSTGDIGGSLSMSGDMSAGTMTNFAIRNIPLVQDDTYTVSATFLPHDGMNTDYETTYGIVLWYQNANNYLVYWLQTKGQENKNEDAGITVGAWSGNLYGKVGGKDRYFYVPESYCSKGITYSNTWRGDEFCDMWYDNSMHAHPDLLNKTSALLTAPVTLKATSSVSSALGETCRKFELYEVVNGTEKKCLEMYVKGITGSSGSFYTGVGAKKMNCTISNFSIKPTKTDFTSGVISKINAIPSTISTEGNINTVIAARNAYDGLLSLKSSIASSYVTKLTTGETNCANLFNTKAKTLDATKIEEHEDAFLEVYNYYNYSFNDYIRAKISAEALENYQEFYRAYGHTCDFGFNFKYDATNHWKECLECGATESNGTHSFDAGKVTIQPTCAVEGTKTYTCVSCGYEKKETIAKKSHSYSEEYLANDTHHYYQCSCGAKKDEDEHTFNAGFITREATCTNTGIKTYTCTTCNHTKEEVLPIVPHDYTGGWSGNNSQHWKTCTICQIEKTETGDHVWDSGTVTKDPTCIDLGVMTYTCTTCSATKEESIDYVDHVFNEEWTTTDNTYHWHECNVCGDKKDNGRHVWDSGVYIVNPTDDVEGIIEYTCTTCNAKKQENVGTLNHTHTFSDEWKHDSSYHWHLADCGHYEVADKAEHIWDSGTVTVEPTCSTAGYMTYTCTECGGTKKEKITTGDHVYEEVYNYDTSSHWLVCVLCNYEDENNKGKHIFDDGVITKEATCTALGVKTYTCTCGFTKTEDVEVISHTNSSEWSSDTGYHWHRCENCMAIDYDTKVRHTWDSGVVDEKATCQSTGRMIYTCTECAATKSEEISLANHEYKTIYDTNATYHYYSCKNCGSIDYTSRTRHAFDDGVVTKEATCSSAGTMLYTCEECNYTKTSSITSSSHSYDEKYIYDANGHWHKCINCDAITTKEAHYWNLGEIVLESTCSKEGMKKYTCIDCGAIKNEFIPKSSHNLDEEWLHNDDCHWHNCKTCGLNGDMLVHNFDEGIILEEASCQSTGLIVYTCQECGFEKTSVLEAMTHSYEDLYHKDAEYHWQICEHCFEINVKEQHYFGNGIVTLEPTCQAYGIKKFECEDCGYTKEEKIALLSHSYIEEQFDGIYHWMKCSMCDSINLKEKHQLDNGTLIGEPTCVLEGLKVYKCNSCSYEFDEITEALGHTKGTEYGYNETNHWYICSICDKNVEVSNHNFDSGTVLQEATCVLDGETKYICLDCGYEKTEKVNKLSHSYTNDWLNDETGHWHKCENENCDAISTKINHNYKVEVISEATCQANGIKKYTCLDCGYSYDETITNGEHKFNNKWVNNETNHWHKCEYCEETSELSTHNLDNGKVKLPATCISKGIVIYSCLDCGVLIEEELALTEHTYNEVYNHDKSHHWHSCINCGVTTEKELHYFVEEVISESTCNSFGVKKNVCSDCGYSITLTTDKLLHEYDELLFNHNETTHWHECKNCQNKVDIRTHHFDEGIVTKEATCTTDGEFSKTCVDCGYIAVTTIKALGHTYSDSWMNDKVQHWTICQECGEISNKSAHAWGEGVVTEEATTSSKGTIKHTCVICGATKTDELDKLPSENSGCRGSIVSSICGLFTLTGAIIFAKKKRKK